MLRRPISINNVDVEANELWLLVATIGYGTRRLGSLHVGDKLNCVLPLGRGFTMPAAPGHRLLLVGGGVGVAPLYFFGKYYTKDAIGAAKASLSPISDDQLAFKEETEKLYKSQKNTIAMFSQMNPYEEWTLYSE